MSDPMADVNDARFESRLSELRGWTAFPPTPNLAPAVAEQIRGQQPSRLRVLPISSRSLWAAVAAVLILLAGLTLVSGTVRNAVADALGIPGIRIEIERDEPTATSLAPPELNLGVEIPLEDATEAAGFMVTMLDPLDVGPPDAVYTRTLPDGVTLVSVLYQPDERLPNTAEAGVGVLLMQFESDYAVPSMVKSMRGDGRIVELQINGALGFWIEGSTELQVLSDVSESRPSGNVLLWQANGVTYRLESALTMEAAVALAESMTVIQTTLLTPASEPS